MWEIILYAVLPGLLAFAGAMPVLALPALFFAFPVLYLMYRRFGIYLPEACVICYGAVSLILNYDVLTVLFFVAAAVAVAGLAAAVQFTFIPALVIAVSTAVIGAFVGVGIVCGAEGGSVGEVASRYVLSHYYDPIINYAAKDYYAGVRLPQGVERIEPDEPGYDAAVAERFAEYTADDYTKYIWYDCIDKAALIAFFGFLVATVVNRRTAGRWDFDSEKADYSLLMSGVKKPILPVAAMRLPRTFLWALALPATVIAIAMGFVVGLGAAASTIIHAFLVLPGAFMCYTLLAYFASLFSGKARVIAHVIVVIVGLAAAAIPVVVFVFSVFGVVDCILNIRFWIEYLSRDD